MGEGPARAELRLALPPRARGRCRQRRHADALRQQGPELHREPVLVGPGLHRAREPRPHRAQRGHEDRLAVCDLPRRSGAVAQEPDAARRVRQGARQLPGVGQVRRPPMKWVIAGLALAAMASIGVGGAASKTADTLQLHGVFHVKWQESECPEGTPPTTACYSNIGAATFPGLGKASEDYVLLVEHADTG